MSYPYGLQGGPAPGMSAPGLPRRAVSVAVASTLGFPAQILFLRSTQFFPVPSWATYIRIGALGNGGAGASLGSGTIPGGGGGGGFAGTNILKLPPGTVLSIRFDNALQAVVVEGLGYRLVAGWGGAGVQNAGGAGGVGSGGDVNNNGAAGNATNTNTAGGGGGAASRYGSGGNPGTNVGGNGGPAGGYMSGTGGGGPNGIGGQINALTSGIGAFIVYCGASSSNLGGDGGGGGPGSYSYGATSGGAGYVMIELW